MQELVAPVSDIKFDIEFALDQQIGSLPLPFPGMDSKHLSLFLFSSMLLVLLLPLVNKIDNTNPADLRE